VRKEPSFLDYKDMYYSPFYSNAVDACNLEGFKPRIVDADYLRTLGVSTEPSEESLRALERGSRLFADRLRKGILLPRTKYTVHDEDTSSIEAEIHNYTGRCPTLTYEINPVRGCGVGCQYCLVSDGVHECELSVIGNYPLYVRRLLDEKNGPGSENGQHYYYFSPKTEAFQEATLLTGVAHGILREFIRHFDQNPDSRARLFIASKAGVRHLLYEDGGESVLDLFEKLKDRMQFNTSVSIMPGDFRNLLEPYAAPIEERLAAVQLCRQRGILADSALVQPILTPYLNEESIRSFYSSLHEAGIINYKPEFLTVCMENLSMLGQYLGHFDKDMERRLYEDYLEPSNAGHRKQRGRTAPDKQKSKEYLREMISFTDTIGMSVSICYWVRMQLGISQEMIPIINRNGFQCLGYQSGLFDNVR